MYGGLNEHTMYTKTLINICITMSFFSAKRKHKSYDVLYAKYKSVFSKLNHARATEIIK